MRLRPSGRKRIEGIVNSTAYSSLHIILSIYIIFSDDILRAFLPKTFDDGFTIFSLVALAIFLLDLVLQSTLDRKQIFSFFWWLDLVRAHGTHRGGGGGFGRASCLLLTTSARSLVAWTTM